MWKRFMIVFAVMSISLSYLYMRLYNISTDPEYQKTAISQGRYVLTVNRSYGTIYDKNMIPMNNNSYKYIAAVNPTYNGISHIKKYALDKNENYNEMIYGLPFLCDVSEDCFETADVKVFKIIDRVPENQMAVHLIGYTRDNVGVSGLEYSFDYILRNECLIEKAVFDIDANGDVLEGSEIKCENEYKGEFGIITTIDRDIQMICETAGNSIEKGAIIVMTPDGEIRAMASFPAFDVNNLEGSLEDENKPFINRTLLPYNVGSVFKLVTAATAIEQGETTDFFYECEGYADVNGKIFRCHKHSGHGGLNMPEAMKNSCNTYFIELSKELDNLEFINMTKKFGFGEKIYLANGISSYSGNIQDENDLDIPAEKANMSFGQGKLTATPLQIARMTAIIANGGFSPEINVVKGTIENEKVIYKTKNQAQRVIDFETSYKLRNFMEYSVNNETSNANPSNTTAAGKTSTAQTGIFDEDGDEVLQAWFTGYFPSDNPKYIVTVLVENGKTGNASAAPVFKEIAEKITILENEQIAERVY